MKIALLISGSFRHAEKGIPTLLANFIKENEVDIFVDTWKIIKQMRIPNDKNDEQDKIINVDNILNLPNLKSARIEDNIVLGKEYKVELEHFINAVYMYYKIQKCFQLMEDYEIVNNFQYDIVIRTRPDLHFELSDLSLLNHCEDNVLYFTHYQYYHGVCDQFFFGKRDLMKKICYLYDDIPKYYAKNSPIHAEKLLHEHYETVGAGKQFMDLCQFGLIRADKIHYQKEDVK